MGLVIPFPLPRSPETEKVIELARRIEAGELVGLYVLGLTSEGKIEAVTIGEVPQVPSLWQRGDFL